MAAAVDDAVEVLEKELIEHRNDIDNLKSSNDHLKSSIDHLKSSIAAPMKYRQLIE
jgi:hypothetical protein